MKNESNHFFFYILEKPLERGRTHKNRFAQTHITNTTLKNLLWKTSEGKWVMWKKIVFVEIPKVHNWEKRYLLTLLYV